MHTPSCLNSGFNCSAHQLSGALEYLLKQGRRGGAHVLHVLLVHMELRLAGKVSACVSQQPLVELELEPQPGAPATSPWGESCFRGGSGIMGNLHSS